MKRIIINVNGVDRPIIADPEKKLADVTAQLAKEKNVEKKAALAAEKALWERRVEQKKAQLSDKQIADQLEKLGYQTRQIKDSSGLVHYTIPAGEELIRWRLWDRNRLIRR